MPKKTEAAILLEALAKIISDKASHMASSWCIGGRGNFHAEFNKNVSEQIDELELPSKLVEKLERKIDKLQS